MSTLILEPQTIGIISVISFTIVLLVYYPCRTSFCCSDFSSLVLSVVII
uniref:Uncharacterized protein n=1 Tax=Arundo donax TaxID=35708 RepID=A0A0A8Z6Y2_ARUDO